MRHVAEPKGWFVATNRRVLNPETRRRREVDLILIHERRWMIIEQKHWSGRVGCWMMVDSSSIVRKGAGRITEPSLRRST